MSFAIQAAIIRLAARFSAALACEVNGCAPMAMGSLPVGSQHSRTTMPGEVPFKSRVKSEDFSGNVDDPVTHSITPVQSTKLGGAASLPAMDVQTHVTEALERHPDVVRVELTGSRACGEQTALSDWDFQIHTTNAAAVARDLRRLVTPLAPLAAQWDRLTERATYMLMLPGAVKVDLFPDDARREIEPPWQPTPENLDAIDAHFWDWTLWLGSKALHGRTDLVDDELRKLHRYLLAPVGVATPPTTVEAAVSEYRSTRDRLEREWNVSVDRRLDAEVTHALQQHGLISSS
jgi:hypothetical protein